MVENIKTIPLVSAILRSKARGCCAVSYYERLQSSIDYIEENLNQDISLEQVARQAYFSMTHFYRIFQAMAGLSIKEYIRKRRLSSAAHELLTSEKRLIDIAFDYRFESQEAFTRAFKSLYGITPGRYRRDSVEVPMVEKLNISETRPDNINGGVFMEPKIIMKNSFKVAGAMGMVDAASDKIAKLWQQLGAKRNDIKNKVNNSATYGISVYIPNITSETEFLYGACVEVSNLSEVPEGMVGKEIPAGKFAVFTHKGTRFKLKDTYDYIYGTWFPNSGYEPAEVDTLEFYDERFRSDAEDSEMEIYIPIK